MIGPDLDGAPVACRHAFDRALVEGYSWCPCTDQGWGTSSWVEVRNYGWMLSCDDCQAETFVFTRSCGGRCRDEQTRQRGPTQEVGSPSLATDGRSERNPMGDQS